VLATGKHAPAVEPEPEPASFTIVVCVAYDRSGPGLVSLAGALLGAQRGGQIHALHLLGGMDRISLRLQEGAAGGAEDGLEPLLARARELDLAVKPISFVSPEPAEDICSVARAKDADLVLIGWHKPMFGRGLLGGTVYQVMKEAGSDVAVFVDRGLSEVRRILLPFVGTPHDHAALKLARRLLRAGVELTLLHVKSPTEKRRCDPSSDEGMKETLEEPEGGRVLVRVVYDDAPVDVALGESRKEYDLVVVGVGGDRGLEQRLLGTHPERLIRESTASLLLIRGHSLPTEERARRQMARAVAT
jgi:nucleotide-binding universal stress UspA family protein